ncbi:MAG: polymer-forming cytoskeletal protein [Ruminococcaceae bacterium]|nr:polymer-forming cytoskeletal protein [Oscillospiraceae bacterium]
MRRDKGNATMDNMSKADVMETIIGESTVFDGCITSSATLRIDGTLNGEVKSKGTVIVGPSGKIKGNIKAKQLYVAGYIEGNIAGEERIEFSSSGHLLGDLSTINLVVEQGAAIDGKCKMKGTAATGALDVNTVGAIKKDEKNDGLKK